MPDAELVLAAIRKHDQARERLHDARTRYALTKTGMVLGGENEAWVWLNAAKNTYDDAAQELADLIANKEG